ncbi:hypothetical protein [Paludibacterium denitrificans]|uniref:hypothetical protein n=1 Tax=Paludibacterium denitrificans TaxID=2675226 RepID=UPI001E504CEF|nr:hypothetical protein [Paludibacterium denitrificans]
MSGSRKYPPFLRTQILYWLVAFNALMVISTLTDWLLPDSWHVPLGLVLTGLGIGISSYLWINMRRIFKLLISLNEQLSIACTGEFHHRAVNTRAMGEVGMVARQLNDFLDLVETYFKEINTCFNRVSHGDYSLAPAESGLAGADVRIAGAYGTGHSIDGRQQRICPPQQPVFPFDCTQQPALAQQPVGQPGRFVGNQPGHGQGGGDYSSHGQWCA